MAAPPDTLKHRSDFLAMNRADKWVTPGFILQYRPAPDATPIVGYTVSKKVGNAVIRNRVKRRLRAIAADILPSESAQMVLIGRPGSEKIAFDQLRGDLKWALKRLKARTKT